MPPWLQQNQRLIFLAIFLGFGALNALYNYLAKQAKIKKEAERRQRELEESLRTGRGIEQASAGLATTAEAEDPGRARREEIARKRREQLEELRRRAAAKAQGGSGTSLPQQQRAATSRPATKQADRPADRPVIAGLDPAQLERKKREAARARDAARRETMLREQAVSRAAAEARALTEAQDRALQQAAAFRASAQQQADAPASSQAGSSRGSQSSLRGRRFTATDWRRAIVMQELLAPPVSMRSEESDERWDA